MIFHPEILSFGRTLTCADDTVFRWDVVGTPIGAELDSWPRWSIAARDR